MTLASSSSFSATGANLFNCTSPAQPATPRALSLGPIFCEPNEANGVFTTAPVTITESLGCGEGRGALLTVTCAGTGVGHDVTVTVTVAIGSSCDSRSATPADPQTFTFQDIAPLGTQSTSLTSCADLDNLCTPTNVCDFTAFHADITVANTLAH